MFSRKMTHFYFKHTHVPLIDLKNSVLVLFSKNGLYLNSIVVIII